MPVGPMPVGPMPVGPMPVGPMPVGPMPVGPMMVSESTDMGRGWFAVMVYFWLLGLGGCLRRLLLAPWCFLRAGKVGRGVLFPCLCALPCPLRLCRGLDAAAFQWLSVGGCSPYCFVAVACRLPNLPRYLRPLSLRCSFGCDVLAAVAPLRRR